MRKLPGLILILLLSGQAQSLARSPARETIGFTYTTNVAATQAVYVVGSHADVGEWNPVDSIKLYESSANVWTGHIAVQAGTDLEYKFIVRSNAAAMHCDPGNVEWMSGPNLSNALPAQPDAPYSGKTMYYHSGWTNVELVYRVGTNWYGTAMSLIGAGRTAGESLYYLDGIGEAGEDLEFIPSGSLGGTQYWDHAPYGGYGNSNYYTTLDVFFLQDGHVYSYWPPSSVSVSRIESTNVASGYDPPIIGRQVRVYLPRGYDQNTWRSYPVLYMHDGTNVFAPGGPYGCWGAESAADREISQGRMRECIIVGVDNSTNRSREYIPPGDDSGAGPGWADRYADYVIHNVRPTIDTHYRTLNDLDNTLVMGSSFGGLVSFYLGLETNVFGKIGPMSTAFWPAPKFMGRIDSNDTLGIRIYMDVGTEEPSLWVNDWDVYDMLLEDGYTVNRDLLRVIGCGHYHNEAAWSNRLGGAYRFLLSLWHEPNLLAQEEYPPVMTNLSVVGSGSVTASCSFMALKGRSYTLRRADDLLNQNWTDVVTGVTEDMPWASHVLADTNAPAGPGPVYYRVLAEPVWP